MPVILQTENLGQYTAVWRIEENLEALLKKVQLATEELQILESYTNENRKKEWLAVRALLQSLRPSCPVIKYKENGKPYLTDGSEEISISHSGPYIAIALSKSHLPGVDIEQASPRIKRIAERFVNEQERTFLTERTLIEQLCLIWCAKEVLYKIHPEGMLNFKNNLLVSPFTLADKGEFEGFIIKDTNRSAHKLQYLRIDNYMLVYTI